MLRLVCPNPQCRRRFKTTATQISKPVPCQSCGTPLVRRDTGAPVGAVPGEAAEGIQAGGQQTPATPKRAVARLERASRPPRPSAKRAQFACEHCGSLISAAPEAAGRRAACPKCTQVTALLPPRKPPPGHESERHAAEEEEAQRQRLEAEEAARRAEEEEAERQRLEAEEAARRAEEEEAERQRLEAEEAARRAEEEEAERQRLEAEEAARRAEEEEAERQRLEAEEAARRAEEEEAERQRLEAEEAARRAEEEEAERQRLEAEEAARRAEKEEAERQQLEAEEAARRAEKEEAERQRLEAEEAARRAEEEEAERQRLEAEEAARRAEEEEAERQRLEAEEAARRAEEEEAERQRLEAEEAARRAEEEEAERQRLEAEEAARRAEKEEAERQQLEAEEAARRAEEEEAERQRLEAEEAARRAEEEEAERQRLEAEEAARRAEEEEAERQRLEAEEAARRAEEEEAERQRLEAEEAERQRLEAEEAARRAEEEEAERQRLEAEEAARRAEEEEAERQRLEAEEAARRAEEEEAERQRLEAEEAARRAEEEEAERQRLEAEEAARRAEEEEAERQRLEAEEAARRAEEEEAERQRLEAEEAARRAEEEEAERQRLEAEEAARRAEEEEAERQRLEAEEAARRAEKEEAERQRLEAEEAARRAEEEEAERQRLEAEEAARRAEKEEAERQRLEAEEAARRAEEEEAERQRLEAEEAARRAEEEEAERQRQEAEEAARRAEKEEAERQQQEAEEAARRAEEEEAARQRLEAEEAEEAERSAEEEEAERQRREAAEIARQVAAKEAAQQAAKEAEHLRQLLASVESGEVPRNRLGVPPARFFNSPLNGSVFGRDVTAAIYGVNPFRYLAVSASAEQRELDAAASRLKAVGRLRPEAAAASFVRLGYDCHLRLEEPQTYVQQLRDPRQRIIYELFWPHLDAETMELLRQDRHLVSRPTIAHLSRVAKCSGGQAAALARHALAVEYHNLAIVGELAYGTGQTESTRTTWGDALRRWAVVYEDDEFWDFLRQRVDQIDHPELRREDVDTLRKKLPSFVLGFNRLFAQAYARGGDAEACGRHLNLIAKARFGEAKRDALISAVQSVAHSRLEPLVQWVQDPTNYRDGEYVGDGVEKDKWTWPEFAELFDPIVARAIELRNYLVDELNISETLVGEAEFDQFSDIVLTGLNQRINYEGDLNRGLLYGLLTMRDLLKLPVTESQRRTLEKQARDDTQLLYKGFVDSSSYADIGWDPLQCWFAPGEPADPTESLLLPVFKITKVQGASVEWESRTILIPRSRTAAEFHRGNLSKADLQRRATDANQLLFREVQQLQAKGEQDVAQVEAERDKRVAEVDRHAAAELETFNERCQAEEAPDRRLVAQAEAELQEQVAREQKQRDAECDQIRNNHRQELERLEAEFDEASRPFRGWGAFPRCEGPTAVASSLTCLAASLVTWFAASGAFLPVLAGGAALAAVVTWQVGRLIRRQGIEHARAPLQAKQNVADGEVRAAQQASQQRIEHLQAAAGEKTAAARQRLAGLDEQRAAIASRADATRTEIAEHAGQKIAELRRRTEGLLQPLQQKLQQATEVKKESAKTSYPVLKRAKSKSYREGERPPKAEVDRLAEQEVQKFFNSLSDSDRQTLAVLHRVLGETKLNELLGVLISLPPSERRAKLRELRSISF